VAKMINSQELAEIVTGLLVEPRLLGVNPTKAEYQHFIEGVSFLITEQFGGCLNSIRVPGNPEDLLGEGLDQGVSTQDVYISVDPDDNLVPSIRQNVWSYHDIRGWDEEEVDGVAIECPFTEGQMEEKRKELSDLLDIKDLGWGES
jgi:hypothetical protein